MRWTSAAAVSRPSELAANSAGATETTCNIPGAMTVSPRITRTVSFSLCDGCGDDVVDLSGRHEVQRSIAGDARAIRDGDAQSTERRRQCSSRGDYSRRREARAETANDRFSSHDALGESGGGQTCEVLHAGSSGEDCEADRLARGSDSVRCDIPAPEQRRAGAVGWDQQAEGCEAVSCSVIGRCGSSLRKNGGTAVTEGLSPGSVRSITNAACDRGLMLPTATVKRGLPAYGGSRAIASGFAGSAGPSTTGTRADSEYSSGRSNSGADSRSTRLSIVALRRNVASPTSLVRPD